MSSNPPYVVIRLVPESPVDGATFATYLDGLALQLIDANTLQPRSDLAYSSPLILFEWPGASGWMSLVSVPTSDPTSYNGSDYGKTLKFDSTGGIPVGSAVYSSDQTTIPPGSLQVTSVTQDSVQLSGTLSKYVPAGTVVSFIGQSPSGDPASAPTNFSFTLSTSSPATTLGNDLIVLHFADTTGITVGMDASGTGVASGTTVAYVDTGSGTVTVSQPLTSSPSSVTFTLNPPFAYFTVKPSSGTPTAKPSTLKFPSNATNGIAVGMTLVPVTGLIAPGTTVTSVTATTVKLSQPLLGPLPSGQQVTFTFPLSNGIVQHVEVTTTSWSFFAGFQYAIIPAAVATAVVPLNPAPPRPDYLDIKVKATRGTETLPLPDTFYNVKVNTSALPQQAYQYQVISPADTSLYVSLPPPPGTHSISLTIPSDGSAPPFDVLYPAIQAALQNDPVPNVSSPADLISSAAACKRIAYDIIWSYQNTLPLPPDPLESLYTNPPNPGGGGNITDTSGGSNNFEQDRQKFEGELGSFYSTNNASAERLTKFVAAASAAVACEQASLNSDSALLEFPVDPSVAYANAVESELLVQGVSVAGPGGLNFGVPAAFFYALGAQLDQSTATVQRFQMATGDAIERLLQQFGTAVDQGIISDTESFYRHERRPRVNHLLPGCPPSRRPWRLRCIHQPLGHRPRRDPAGVASPGLAEGHRTSAPEPAADVWQHRLQHLDTAAGQRGPHRLPDLDLDALTQGYCHPGASQQHARRPDRGLAAHHDEPSDTQSDRSHAEAGDGGAVDGVLHRAREPAVAAAVHPAGRPRRLARPAAADGRLHRAAHPGVHPRGASVLHRLLRRHVRPAPRRQVRRRPSSCPRSTRSGRRSRTSPAPSSSATRCPAPT